MILKCAEGGTPHPEGIFAAVCVDVIDLGLRRVEYRGEEKVVPKLRIIFETDDGETRWLSRSATASLHPKSRLAELLGKWRGKPFLPGEEFDTRNLIGASATLVVSQQARMDGTGMYANIDAISRPTRKVTPSGKYNPDEAREKIRLADAKSGHAAPPRQAPRPAPQTREQELPQGTEPVGVGDGPDEDAPF